MNGSNNSHGIGSLDDLEQEAKKAADALTVASGHSAIWDKVVKAPG